MQLMKHGHGLIQKLLVLLLVVHSNKGFLAGTVQSYMM
jgi:hypothetical protein